MISKIQHHSAPLTILLIEMAAYLILWFNDMFNCQMSLFLMSCTQITYQSSSTNWITLILRIFWLLLKHS